MRLPGGLIGNCLRIRRGRRSYQAGHRRPLRSRRRGPSEMKLDDIKEQLKKLEVFRDGKSIYEWEPSEFAELPWVLSELGELPYVIVLSKTERLLWGYELLQTVQGTARAVRLNGADKVIALWRDGTI